MPASCEQVKAWKEKEKNDSENVLWMRANTKPCPKCGVSIEKNSGCNSVKCSRCKFVFCWLCGVEERLHGQNTHIFEACNRYKEQIKNNPNFEQEQRDRANAKDELAKYGWYM